MTTPEHYVLVMPEAIIRVPSISIDTSARALEVGFRILDSDPARREMIDSYIEAGIVWSVECLESVNFGAGDEVRIHYWLGNSNLYNPYSKRQWLDAGGELP